MWSAAVLALYPLAAHHYATVMLDVFAIGMGGALATVLQTRLMDVAGDAQALAAALNHSAFNVANALGPWLGGMAIAAGFGLTSTGYVGCALALGRFGGVGDCARGGARPSGAVAGPLPRRLRSLAPGSII